MEEPNDPVAVAGIVFDTGGSFGDLNLGTLDFKDDFFLLPAGVGDAADVEKGAFELDGAGREELFKLELGEEVALGFAIESAFGGGAGVVEMGGEGSSVTGFDGEEAFHAVVALSFDGQGSVDRALFFIISVKSHADTQIVGKVGNLTRRLLRIFVRSE